jgi:hypothetical protein
MSVTELRRELERLGVRLEVRGDQLAFHPTSALADDMVQQLRTHKADLVALLTTTTSSEPFTNGQETSSFQTEEDEDECPAAHFELQEIDWNTPCSCGSLELWETVGGDWRCLRCHPPEASRRLRALAERIRQRSANRARLRHVPPKRPD